jgi:hypothetical protein
MNKTNGLHSISFFVAVAAALAGGCSGGNGAAGKDGTSCSLTDNHDGTATIRCADGTSFTVTSGTDGTNGTNGTNGMNGTNGTNGTSCTLTGADGGTRTLTCGADGGAITVVDAVADYAVMTADEKAQAAMTAVITGVSFPRRRSAGGQDQGQRAPRAGRQEPRRDRGELAVRAAEAGPRVSAAPSRA